MDGFRDTYLLRRCTSWYSPSVAHLDNRDTSLQSSIIHSLSVKTISRYERRKWGLKLEYVPLPTASWKFKQFSGRTHAESAELSLIQQLYSSMALQLLTHIRKDIHCWNTFLASSPHFLMVYFDFLGCCVCIVMVVTPESTPATISMILSHKKIGNIVS